MKARSHIQISETGMKGSKGEENNSAWKYESVKPVGTTQDQWQVDRIVLPPQQTKALKHGGIGFTGQECMKSKLLANTR
jgi:hypothetical protein